MTISKEILLDNNERLIISKACNNDAANIIAFLNRVGGETDFLAFGLGEFDVSVTYSHHQTAKPLWWGLLATYAEL